MPVLALQVSKYTVLQFDFFAFLIWRTSTVFRFLDLDESFKIISPHCFNELDFSWFMLAMVTAALKETIS